MATTHLNTRIKNRLDTFKNWSDNNPQLLEGEIALVSVTTTTEQKDGSITYIPAVLMKVGGEKYTAAEAAAKGDASLTDKLKKFNDLPWLSAKAADVYDWAKEQFAADIPVTFNDDGTPNETLGEYLAKVNDQATDIANIKTIFAITDTGTGSFVTDVAYDNNTGTFTLSRGNVGTNDITDGAVTKDKLGTGAVTVTKIADGAVTNDKIDGVDAIKVSYSTYSQPTEGTLPAVIGDIQTKISTLEGAVEGGVHFIGITTEAPYTKTENGSQVTYVKLDGKETKAVAGDMIIYSGTESIDTDGDSSTTAESNSFDKEYISTGTAWQEVGDLSRVGKLETWRKGLDYAPAAGATAEADKRTSGAAVHNKFVTSVTQVDGKIAVTYARPDASDISYGSSDTVATVIATHEDQLKDLIDEEDNRISVADFVDSALGDLDFTVDRITDGGTGANFTFISEVTQADGQISAKKKTIQDASTSVKGVVQLSDTTTGAIVTADSTTAATTKAVKTVALDLADTNTAVSNIEGNYVKYNSTTKHAYVGKNGDDGDKATTDYIIFNCGNANGWD